MVDWRGGGGRNCSARNRKDDDFNWNFDSRMNIPGLKRQLRSNRWYIEARWCTFVIELGFCRLAFRSSSPPPRTIRKIGSAILDRVVRISSFNHRKTIGSIYDSSHPWYRDRGRRRNGCKETFDDTGKWDLFICVIYFHKQKQKKPRKLRGGRARNNGERRFRAGNFSMWSNE